MFGKPYLREVALGNFPPMEPTPPPQTDVTTHTLAAFLNETSERDNPGDVFELESTKMLEARVKGKIWSKLGAMIAYRGNVKFNREGMMAGGFGKALLKMVSGEMSPLVEISGDGLVYLADSGKQITILKLEGDSINVSGNDLLAFEDTVSYDITMHKRVAGMMAGGLFSAKLSGRGMVAIGTHGKPLTLRVRTGDPVITDPNATVAWSSSLQPEIRTDISMKSLFGRGGGESFQMVFQGDGFVVVQPFEETHTAAPAG